MTIFPGYRISASLVITIIFPFMLKDRNTKDRLLTIFKKTLCLTFGLKKQMEMLPLSSLSHALSVGLSEGQPYAEQ